MNYTFIFKNRDAAEKFYELIKCECSNASNLRRYIDCDYNGDYELYSWLVDVKLES